MNRAARVADRQCRHAEIPKRLHPGLEYWRNSLITLQVNTTNRTCSVIDIEISRELVVSRLQLHVTAVREMFGDVRARSENAFFLACPQRNADGPSHFHACCLEDSYGFEHHRRSGGVIRRSCSRVP